MSRKLISIAAVCLIVGYLSGKNSRPDKVVENSSNGSQERIVTQLKAKIKTLSEENIKTKTVTVIVEKPDGTKTTTKTKDLEKFVNKYSLNDQTENKNIQLSSKSEIQKVTINNSKRNAIGLSMIHVIGRPRLVPVAFIRTGTKCLFLSCSISVGYGLETQQVSIGLGVAIRF